MSIQTELSEATKTPRKSGESEQAFLRRLHAKAANPKTLPAEVWETLSGDAQNWVNAATEAAEKGEDLPSLGSNGEDHEAAEAAADKEAAKQAKAPKSAPKAKAPAKKAAPAAKAKGKKPAPAAKAKGKAKKETNGRGRKGSFPLDAKIKLTVKENPHRPGSILHKQFAKYKNGMTVQEALSAGVLWTNLRYLSGLEIIKIS